MHLPPTIILATGNPHKVEELRAIIAATTRDAAAHHPHPRPLAPRVVGLSGIPGGPFPEPAEIGSTFAENARIKAASYAHQIARRIEQNAEERGTAISLRDALVLADDSGIEIDALKLADGTPRPGVISSHYATDGVETGLSREQRDAANNARVLRELEGVPTEQRTARFVCCMCLVQVQSAECGVPSANQGTSPSPHSALSTQHSALHITRGTMEGRIGTPPRIPAGHNGFGYDPLFLVAAPPPPHLPYSKTGAELTSAEKNALSHRGMAARAMVEWVMSTLD